MLVLADMNAPGWRVEVDGRTRPLLAADLVLRGVALEAGDHTVRFIYGDPSVRAGLSLSILGVVLRGGAAGRSRTCRRPRPPTSAGVDA